MKIEIKEVFKNSLYLLTVQGLNYILPLLTLPYLLETLSVDSFGKYSFAFAFSQFAILFVDFGFNLSGVKKIAENSDNILLVKQTFWRIISIKFLFFVVVCIFIFLAFLLSTTIQFYIDGIICSLLMIFGTVFFPTWWFVGMNKLRPLSFINVFSKILIYPFIFLFVINENDYSIAIAIQSLTFLVAAIISLFYIRFNHSGYFKFKNLDFNYLTIKKEINYAFPIFLSNSSISLYTNSLTIFLGFVSSSYIVGAFGALERIVRVICFGILGPINQSAFSIIAKVKKNNLITAKKIFSFLFLIVFILLIFAYLFFIFSKKYIFSEFLNEYQEFQNLLVFFMLTIFPIALGGVCGQLGLLALGDDSLKKIFSRIYIFCGLSSVPLSLFAIYYFNIYGAIFSMMAIETVLFIFMFYYTIKNNLFRSWR